MLKKTFKTFCELFKLQAKKTPNAIAGLFENLTITYEELDNRATQLAHFLKTNGVQPGTVVALSLNNSLNLLIGMLGIFQAGGVYLPIDPNYPIERIESMLTDAKPALLLTDKDLSSKFSSSFYKVVQFDSLPVVEKTSPSLSIEPHHLAYIIYTSGSTGNPKGILLTHEALSYAALAHRPLHPIKLISLLAGSISFDASLLVIVHTLISGGTVCIPSSSAATDPEQIVLLIEKYTINYILCVPSFYTMLLSRARKLPSLQSVDLGGEVLPPTLASLHANIAPHAMLHNIYGPSEYAVGATFAKIYDPIDTQIHPITIGKPFTDTSIHILNEHLQPLPIGIKGEIFIGGPGLARGYLNKETLSAEKFMQVSLPGQAPIRLYRTGDFGRFLPDGNIEFLGRVDHQIKIRGYRIELGEIEYSMNQYPEVNEAIVIVHQETTGSKRLFGYFSTASKEKHLMEKLRTHLENTLPEYMIPSVLIQIENWPLTLNGKIDRAILSKLAESYLPKTSLKQPSSEPERFLFQIWKELLNRDNFGVDDNFFDLGGDSLQIANMQIQLETKTGAKVSIADLFQYPTIAQLARELFAHKKNSPKSKENVNINQRLAFQQFRKNRRS